jgi:carbamoyl-phosphate synthase large subunit
VTAAGRRTSLVTAFADEVHTRHGRVLAADVDPLAPALFLVDEAIQMPATGDPGYVSALFETVTRCGIGLLVPTIDPELPILARNRAALASIGCVAAVSDESFIAITSDKLATVSAFGARGVAVPLSWVPGDHMTDIPDSVFVKPRQGSASQGARVATREELERIPLEISDPIIQEVLTGPEISIDALLDLEGRSIHYVPRQRLRTLAGESIEGVTLEHDRDLERWIESLLEICSSLGGAGPLCLQAFLTERGPVLSEINARFGGGFPLSLAAGGRYPGWLLDMMEGVRVPSRLGTYDAGLYMTRSHTEYFTTSLRW